MLDRILNFLFRKKIGVLIVIALMCAVAFTMTGCSDDIYDEYYEIRVYYYRIVNDKEESLSYFYVDTDKVFKDDKPPKSYTLNVSNFYKDTYYDLEYILDGNNSTVNVNEDGDFTLKLSDYSEWKSGEQTYVLPFSYKVVLNEKRHNDPVNIYLGYAGVDKNGDFLESGIDRETELKTTVKVGETLHENAFTAPAIEGYTFKGYYYASISNKKAEKDNIAYIMGKYNIEEGRSDVWEFSGLGKDFHLSSYGINPTNETLEFTVIAVYEEIKSDVYVRVIKNGQLSNYGQIGWGVKYDYKLSELYADVVEKKNEMEVYKVPTGAKFIGWSTNENGSDIKSSIDTLASSDMKINADTTVYLFYKTKAQIVLHNYEKPNVGTKTITGEDDSELYYGDSYTLPTTLPKNGRFTFVGWYKDESLTDAVNYLDITVGKSVEEFWVKWKETTNFTAKYYLNRKNYNDSIDSVTFNYDYKDGIETLIGDEGTFVSGNIPNGYTFEGWFVLDESGNKLTKDPVKSLAKQTYECNLSLIAAYSIDVELVYGSNAYDCTVYYQEPCTLKVPLPTDDSKKFDGWFTKREGGERVSAPDGSVESFEVIFETDVGNFLFETWATKTFKVSFYQYNSTTCEPKTVEYNGTVTAPVAADRQYYTFKGWFTAKEGGTEFDPNAPVTSDITYYAQYTPNKYTITFLIDGTNWKDNDDTDVCFDVYYGQKEVELPTPTITGKYFVGWFYKNEKFTDRDGNWVIDKAVTEDIILEAVFI